MKQIPNFVETPDNFVKFFIDRVRSNLHVVLCMSPVGVKFPERARKFPGSILCFHNWIYAHTFDHAVNACDIIGIIAGCTIDWFLPWPKEALVAVRATDIHTK